MRHNRTIAFLMALILTLSIFLSGSISAFAESQDTTAPVITALYLDKQGETLRAGDTLTLNVSITEESDISTCQIIFDNETTGARRNMMTSFKHSDDGEYSFTYTIDDGMAAGKWVFNRVSISDKYDNYEYDSCTITDRSSIFFYVESDINDTTAPVITALYLDKQGEALRAGDVLTLNLSITEESDISTCQITG